MAIDKAKIEQIMKAQLEETGWNFYHERQHVENLFYSRFNFFLVLYGMFVAAIVTLQSDLKCKFDSCVIIALVFFAIIILSLVWATLCRNYQTLRMVLCILDKGLPAYHSSPILSKYMKENSKIWRSGDLMAKWIPACCLMSLYVYFFYICVTADVDILVSLVIIGFLGIEITIVSNFIIVLNAIMSNYACDDYFETSICEDACDVNINKEFNDYQEEKKKRDKENLFRIKFP